MNLPASAVEFLDVFEGAFCPDAWSGHELPMVHVYTFQTPAESDSGGCLLQSNQSACVDVG